MNRKLVLVATLIVVLVAIVGTGLYMTRLQQEQPKEYGMIYVRNDGSVDPQTAPILSVDNRTYTFIDDIYSVSGIVIERHSTIIDGNGYTLQCIGDESGAPAGFALKVANVTVVNTNIKGFKTGIQVWTSKNTISGNNITANKGTGIVVGSGNNIVGNNIVGNGYYGIDLSFSSGNTVSENKIADNNFCGILFSGSLDKPAHNNTVSGNIIANNGWDGIFVLTSSNNTIVGNNIIENTKNGIWLRNASEITISKNNITYNELSAISVESGGDQPFPYLSNNISIGNNNITNNGEGGIVISESFGNRIYDNLLKNDGVSLGASSNNSIHKNILTNGDIYLGRSSNNSISDNVITDSGGGIYVHYESSANAISGNLVTNSNGNWGAVSIRWSSHNNNFIGNNITANKKDGIQIWLSSNNSISRNEFTDNGGYAIWLGNSSNNSFNHNSFKNNSGNIYDYSLDEFTNYPPSESILNSSYPSGGNYWDNYSGIDYYSGPYQNETGCDGIGDKPHLVYLHYTDNYPLMGPFFSFETSLGHNVNIVSNSTIGDLQFFTSNDTIKVYVSRIRVNQTFGFCRICVPHALMSNPTNIIIDGATLIYWNPRLYDDGTHRWIYFSYGYS